MKSELDAREMALSILEGYHGTTIDEVIVLRQLVRELSGVRGGIHVSDAYIRLTGSLEAGAFLSQMVYWMDKGSGDGWFYKTDEEFAGECGLTLYSIRKQRERFESAGWVLTFKKAVNRSAVHHYWVNLQKLAEDLRGSQPLKSQVATIEIDGSQQAVPVEHSMVHRLHTQTTHRVGGHTRKELPKLEELVPAEFNIVTFLEAWMEWRQHRQAIKKPMSVLGERKLLKRLVAMSEGKYETAIAIVEQSIANDWQGLFALKDLTEQDKEKREMERYYKRLNDSQSQRGGNA